MHRYILTTQRLQGLMDANLLNAGTLPHLYTLGRLGVTHLTRVSPVDGEPPTRSDDDAHNRPKCCLSAEAGAAELINVDFLRYQVQHQLPHIS